MSQVPQTMVERGLSRFADHPVRAGEIVVAEPDGVMSHDNTAFIVDRFRQMGAERVWAPERIVIVLDHCVPAPNEAYARNHREAEAFAAEQGITEYLGTRAGVSHQVMMERGHVLPGRLVLGADSHSTLYGALNAIGIPINRTEMAAIWATGTTWLRVPQTLAVRLSGSLPPGVSAKDLCLWLLRQLGADGAAYRCLEFQGEGAAALDMSSRMTLCNMAVELGAKVGIFPCDAVAREYLDGRARDAFEPLTSDADAHYERVFDVDLGELEPQLACPHTVDNVVDVSERAGTRIHQAYLGSCTNGRLEDLRVAADILRGNRIANGVRLVVYPASVREAERARDEGVLSVLEEAGAEIMTASCGPCFGVVGATLQEGEVCLSSSNRNFQGRMGSRESFVYLASPATVAASCLHGAITDPRSVP